MTATVFVPRDTSAVATNADGVAARFAELGAHIVRNGSRGLSFAEPFVEIDEGGVRIAFANVTVDDVESILAERTAHRACLGPTDELDYLKRQHRLVFDRAGLDAPLELPHGLALENVIGRIDELVDEIETAGLRGRGGAGFPAHIKWRTVRDTPADQKYIVCNADEGDSGTFADRLLMESDPFRLIEGMTIAGLATGATHGLIYLRSEYPLANEILEAAIAKAYATNHLGARVLGSDYTFDLEVFVGAGAYICGEETSLLESLEGKRGEIRSKPPVPAIAGLFGKPTLVHNVISFAAVPAIFQAGPATYGELGVGPSAGTMAFQLAGNVARGGLIECPFGISLREIVESFGGGTRTGRPIRAVQIGGPLGAYLSTEELDTPLTYEAMAALGAGIGHGGIVVFDDSVNLAEQAHYAFKFCEVESCGKCTPCRIGAVRGREKMDKLLAGEADDRDREALADLLDVMESASLCQMGGMTPIPVRSAMQRFPEDFN